MTEELRFIEKGKEQTPLDSIESFVEVIGKLYDKYNEDIEGIAISLPGIIDSEKGYAYTGGQLKYNDDKFIVKILKERCPTKITIENDAKCAALAEVWKGCLKDYQDGIVIVLGTGDADYPLHNEKFNIDEDCLPLASAMHAQFAIDFLSKK